MQAIVLHVMAYLSVVDSSTSSTRDIGHPEWLTRPTDNFLSLCGPCTNVKRGCARSRMRTRRENPSGHSPTSPTLFLFLGLGIGFTWACQATTCRSNRAPSPSCLQLQAPAKRHLNPLHTFSFPSYPLPITHYPFLHLSFLGFLCSPLAPFAT